MKKISTLLAIILSAIALAGAVYRFDHCKASKESVIKLASSFEIYRLEQYRRSLQQRIWDIQKSYPNTYIQMMEYRRLVDELRMIDMKIKAYYQRKGK